MTNHKIEEGGSRLVSWWTFYWGVMRELPRLLREAGALVFLAANLVSTVLLVFNQQLAARFTQWRGISPWWALASIGVLLAAGLGRAIFSRYTEVVIQLDRQCQRVAELEAVTAKQLTDGVLAIDPVSWPVIDARTDARVGTALGLRMTELAGVRLERCRIRFSRLQKVLSGGQWLMPEWFRPCFLHWEGTTQTEDIPAHGERTCEFVVADRESGAMHLRGPGGQPWRSAEGGLWRAQIEIEAEGYGARRASLLFEWQPAWPPHREQAELFWVLDEDAPSRSA